MQFDEWLGALQEAQKRRQFLYERVHGRLLWVLYEQLVMLSLVNETRLKNHLPCVPLEAIQAAEQQALAPGAAGSATRFVIRCMELAGDQMP